MAESKNRAAPAPPEETPVPEVPTVVAGPAPAEPERARIWSEVELVAGALREHWTEEHHKLVEAAGLKVEEVTDNA